jgi:hypothetical protein
MRLFHPLRYARNRVLWAPVNAARRSGRRSREGRRYRGRRRR